MKIILNTLRFLALILVFWIITFHIERLLFSFHHWHRFEGVAFGEWLSVFYHSLRVDIAMASMLTFLPLIIFLLSVFWTKNFAKKILFVVVFIEVILISMIHAGEINAYSEWSHKLTARVFKHLSNPDEVFRSADYSMTLWFICYFIIECLCGYFLFKWIIRRIKFLGEREEIKFKYLLSAITFVLASGILFVSARGGIQVIPVTINSAFFSNNYILNDVSANSAYFFGDSYITFSKSDIEGVVPKYSDEEIEKYTKDLFEFPKDSTLQILSNKSPNLVFVVLESWPAQAVESYGEIKGATRHIDSLIKQGFWFDNIYATSTTSDIGNASIFCGFPAIPEISISTQTEKHRKIPSLNQSLEGYDPYFLFSGDLNYGNIGGFFFDHGFSVEDENGFSKDLERGKLNYFDEDLYDKFLGKINERKDQFLYCAFTGSTHSPYDYPNNDRQDFTGHESAFMNSMIYADSCLGDFIERAKKEEWYDNTLFVIVADHSHATPKTKRPYETSYYKIPLLFFGEPIAKEFRGKKCSKLGSQTDIVATLLAQMSLPSDNFTWSKNLLNPNSPQYAFHAMPRGFGWITPSGHFSFNFDQQRYLEESYSDSTIRDFEINQGKAYFRKVYNSFQAL